MSCLPPNFDPFAQLENFVSNKMNDCINCSKKFATDKDLEAHMNVCEKAPTCVHCEQKFATSTSLQRHQQEYHAFESYNLRENLAKDPMAADDSEQTDSDGSYWTDSSDSDSTAGIVFTPPPWRPKSPINLVTERYESHRFPDFPASHPRSSMCLVPPLHENRNTYLDERLNKVGLMLKERDNLKPVKRCETKLEEFDVIEIPKIIFPDLCKSYLTDTIIECKFYIGEDFLGSVMPNDTIGLYRVGYTDEPQSIVSQMVVQCETFDEWGGLCFKFEVKSEQLAEDISKFDYHVCYRNANIGICGESMHFQLINASAFHAPDDEKCEPVVECGLDDFIVVNSEEALLKKIDDLECANELLERSKLSYEREISDLKDLNDKLIWDKAELKERVGSLQTELSQYNQRLENRVNVLQAKLREYELRYDKEAAIRFNLANNSAKQDLKSIIDSFDVILKGNLAMMNARLKAFDERLKKIERPVVLF